MTIKEAKIPEKIRRIALDVDKRNGSPDLLELAAVIDEFCSVDGSNVRIFLRKMSDPNPDIMIAS